MKFKDLKAGDWFRMSKWLPGVVCEKIEPYEVKSSDGQRVAHATHKEVATGIRGWDVGPNDKVIEVKKEGK